MKNMIAIKKSYILYKNQESYKELYAQNGTKVLYRYTVNDTLQGPYQLLDSLGNILLDYRYLMGLRNGWCREFDSKGKLLFSKYYQNGNPIGDSIEVERKLEWEVLTPEELKGLDYLIRNQSIDTTLFSLEQIHAYTKLIYRHFPDLLGPLPQNEIHGFIDNHYYTTLHFLRIESCVLVHIKNNNRQALTLIVYPDMEIESFNHLLTKDEFLANPVSPYNYYMWKD